MKALPPADDTALTDALQSTLAGLCTATSRAIGAGVWPDRAVDPAKWGTAFCTAAGPHLADAAQTVAQMFTDAAEAKADAPPAEPPPPDNLTPAQKAALTAAALTVAMHDDGDPVTAGVAIAAKVVQEAAEGLAEAFAHKLTAARQLGAKRKALALVAAGWAGDHTATVAGLANRAVQVAQGATASRHEQLLAATVGKLVRRVWRTRKDDRVRETHRLAEGQQRKIGQSFKVGDALLRYPGDPEGPPGETINCRCRLGWSFGVGALRSSA